eukprot:c14496_g1_i1.p1 GENE.c14496_g1_i1~~c14496_g1_i1.p1  ORF type:complete len:335 (+),score=56.50 c14496_g1_i1:26-1030(+)
MALARWGLAVLNTTSSWAVVCLTVYFGHTRDLIWCLISACMIGLATTFNEAVCWYDHPEHREFCIHTAICLLQCKPLADAQEYHKSAGKRAEFRAKKFIASVLQAVPVSALVSYVLVLDLHGRINEHFLFGVAVLLFVTFSVGTTHFAAAEDDSLVQVAVFSQVLAQFMFRMLALSAVWGRFKLIGGVAAGLPIFFIVYLAGPQGIRHRSCKEAGYWMTIIIKLALPVLTSFLVIDAVYEKPSDSQRQSVKASDCFHNTHFLIWRMIENYTLLICFAAIPEQYWQRDNSELEGWVANEILIWPMAVCFTCTIAASWFNIRSSATAHNFRHQQLP